MAPHKQAAKHAAKKVAHKAAKKAAKKVAKKAAGHGRGQDVRRAYEHLHRIGVLHQLLGRDALDEVEKLSRLAQRALVEGDGRSAADLLRAAEHLAFGSLALQAAEAKVGDELTDAAQAEFEHLTTRARDQWAQREEDEVREIASIFSGMLRAAETARKAAALHRALEFARGAEALTHVEPGQRTLSAGRKAAAKRLRS